MCRSRKSVTLRANSPRRDGRSTRRRRAVRDDPGNESDVGDHADEFDQCLRDHDDRDQGQRVGQCQGEGQYNQGVSGRPGEDQRSRRRCCPTRNPAGTPDGSTRSSASTGHRSRPNHACQCEHCHAGPRSFVLSRPSSGSPQATSDSSTVYSLRSNACRP